MFSVIFWIGTLEIGCQKVIKIIIILCTINICTIIMYTNIIYEIVDKFVIIVKRTIAI